MRIKSKRGIGEDFYLLSEKNMLHSLVKLYGAYIKYTSESADNSDDSFVAFYNAKKDYILYNFNTLANRDIQKFLFKKNIKVSIKKLRQITITRKKHFVYSYTWVSLYFDYIIHKIFEIDVLGNYAVNNILTECSNIEVCSNRDKESQIIICKNALLGFQFEFLELVKTTYSEKKANAADQIIKQISDSTDMVIRNCTNSENY